MGKFLTMGPVTLEIVVYVKLSLCSHKNPTILNFDYTRNNFREC